jgi:hypothetical protein
MIVMGKQNGAKSFMHGMVYSISIFLMLSAIFALSIFWLDASSRRISSIETSNDMQILNSKLLALRLVSMQQLGINASLGRNSTSIWLNVSDDGFPFASSLAGRVNIAGLKQSLESDWASISNASLAYNVSALNSTGRILLTNSSGLYYEQDNSNSAYDQASLGFASGVPSILSLNISCRTPSGAASIIYASSSPAGNGALRAIYFATFGDFNNSTSSIVEFSPLDDQNFSAKYYDSSTPPQWMHTLHADWRAAESKFVVWDEFNESYPGLSKNSARCWWNILAVKNFTNEEDELDLLINISASYGWASYSGWLVLARS